MTTRKKPWWAGWRSKSPNKTQRIERRWRYASAKKGKLDRNFYLQLKGN